jgi:hypothetical protein
MSVFGAQYASYYDLFYADKDYPAEVVFVQDVIHRYNPRANLLLEFGCVQPERQIARRFYT